MLCLVCLHTTEGYFMQKRTLQTNSKNPLDIDHLKSAFVESCACVHAQTCVNVIIFMLIKRTKKHIEDLALCECDWK